MDIDWVSLTSIFSNVATAVTFPVTAAALLYSAQKDRISKEHENDGDLKDIYFGIIDQLIENPELDQHKTPLEDLATQQRQYRLYEKLVMLFETAYLRLARETSQELREMWESWEDCINEWVEQPNFQQALPRLLKGENPQFAEYMRSKLAQRRAMENPCLSGPSA